MDEVFSGEREMKPVHAGCHRLHSLKTINDIYMYMYLPCLFV